MSLTETIVPVAAIAPAPKQTRFAMPLADDVRLVTVETARAVRGVTAEQIFEWVEDHQDPMHLPAFDVSLTQGARRELRIWAGALRQADAAKCKLDTIIADCLLTTVDAIPNKSYNINNSQLERAWCVSNDLLIDLIRLWVRGAAGLSAVRVGRNWRVNRASAAEFLKRRAQ